MSKIKSIQQALAQQGIETYILPHGDAYGNEAPAPRDREIEFLTNFSGSAGVCLVSQGQCAIFVDGRYTIQVQEETDPLQWKIKNLDTHEIVAWIGTHTPKGKKVGVDTKRISIKEYTGYKEMLEKEGISLVPCPQNPMDSLWVNRPALELCTLEDYPLAGEESHAKCKRLGADLQAYKAESLCITQCDNLMWLLNTRGTHSPESRLAFGYGLLESTGTLWVYTQATVPESLKAERPHVRWVSFEEFMEKAKQEKAIGITPKCPAYISLELKHVVSMEDTVALAKAVKNPMELITTAAAHRTEGLAISKIIHRIKTGTLEATEKSEYGLSKAIEVERKKNNSYKGISFQSIVAMNASGAIIHYRPKKEKSTPITEGVLLLDVGGQYEGGTTDATRTLYVGNNPPEHYKIHYTKVLKGHIALMTAQYTNETTQDLDTMARKPLADIGADYPHGTGHGVSVGLCVHEAPYRIAKTNPMPLKAGLILSNEPGYYEEGAFGIRIEDCMVIRADGKGYVCESLTRIPFDKDSMIIEDLTEKERLYINQYQYQVYETHKKQCTDTLFLQWLKEYTQPLGCA